MNTISKLLIACFACIIFFNACKPSIDPEIYIDPRDKFTGTYKITETHYCYGPCSNCYGKKDSIITIKKGVYDGTIQVLGIEIQLDSLGEYHSHYWGLKLWNDSIEASHTVGGLGCGVNYIYSGYKISSKFE